MLATILKNPMYTSLATPATSGGEAVPVWQALLDLAVSDSVDALLDCGALLAGVSHGDAAQYLLRHLDLERHSAVCYFDITNKQWMVRDVRGRCLPRHSSPVAEREAFVIFDDARCRGADLQLRQDAVGLLTLGPGICKDKLMQAAGRLRQFGRGQTLRIVGTPEVSAKITSLLTAPQHHHNIVPQDNPDTGRRRSASRSSCAPATVSTPVALTSLHVLQWVMHNTVQATLAGIPEWSRQGLHFVGTKDAPHRAALDEVLELEQFYGGLRAEKAAADVVAALTQQQLQRCGQDLAVVYSPLLEQINTRAGAYGAGHTVVTGGAADEECERELEQEREEEAEREKEVARVLPAREEDWDYAAALTAACAQDLPSCAHVLGLADVAQLLQPACLQDIGWSAKVFCTRNFTLAIQNPTPTSPLNKYMRAVTALLQFPDGQVLLLSEREADGVQAAMWEHTAHGGGETTGGAPRPVLQTLCYARLACYSCTAPNLAVRLAMAAHAHEGPRSAVRGIFGRRRPTDADAELLTLTPQQRQQQRLLPELVCLQVFNGEASYGEASSPQFIALRRLMRGRKDAAEALVCMRGKRTLLPCSDLELACDDVMITTTRTAVVAL